MIEICIPNNNIKERKYSIDILFGEFLGLEYKVKEEENNSNYVIILENANKLVIQDSFFNAFSQGLSYLSTDNIPKSIGFGKNDFILEEDIPIIFGNDSLKIKTQETQTIVCGIDIFASSFFMLTRWEEYVNKTRDSHGRFPEKESLASKQGFLHRPVVNEYVQMLWNILKYLDHSLEKKSRKYNLMMTHDVDVPLKYPTVLSGLKAIIGDIIKRKDISLFYKNLRCKLFVHLKLKKDPYDTFDYLMDISEKRGIRAYFFFMAKGQTMFDNYYSVNSKFAENLISKIKNRGHHIGIHPSYNAYADIEQFQKEKKELEYKFNMDIQFGREHYLRFEIPYTWQIWEDNNMKWDSTLSYAGKEGFRCGVCYEYSVFNILTRKQLALKERPLIVMETSFRGYQKDIKSIDMLENISYLVKKVKQYDGSFVFLWHNSGFEGSSFESYKYVYEQVFEL